MIKNVAVKKYFRIFLIIIVFIGCTPEDNNKVALEPNVYTLNAVVENNGGVTLNGEFETNENPIDNKGFEYALDSLFTNRRKIIQFENLSKNNEEFSFFLGTGIEKNTKYFYRAYIISNYSRYFGEAIEFMSNGSIAPQIGSISNKFGHFADTISIFGNYFKDDFYPTNIDFSDRKSTILSVNDTLIKCLVPNYLNSVRNNIRVRISNREAIFSSFELYAPIINSIKPIQTVIEDTICIYGSHYDIVNNRNKVYFGSIEAKVIASNRDSLKVIVPSSIENPISPITLKAQLQEVTFDQDFSLSPPVITNIAPIKATFREEIEITGDNFDIDISRTKVYFGEVETTITYVDKNLIKVVVPDNLESSSEPIKVVSQLQEIIYSEKFSLIPPVINFVPESISTNQEIEIIGTYFHPIKDRNIVTFENVQTNVLSGNTESLNIKIPNGPFPRRKIIVKVQVLDLIVKYEVELNILDKWIMVSNNLPFRFNRSINNAVVVNNEAYVIAYTGIYDSVLYLWKFNPSDYSWEQSNIPFEMRSSAVMNSCNDKIYLYDAQSDNGFWEFDPLSKQWTQLTPFPGARRDYPTHFSIDGDIYIGMGADYEPYRDILFGDFYKYDTKNDSWTRIADFTFQNYFRRTETSTFTIKNIAYIGNGASNTGMVDYWSYHPNSDEWIRIADYNDARNDTASFELNGFGYVTGGIFTRQYNDCWRYEPSSNTWTQDENIGHFARAGHFSFSLNGKAYIGGGQRGIFFSSQSHDLYEFIP